MRKPVVCRMWLAALFLISVQVATAQPRTFDIYWVDVEGGAATLVVSPSGESLLVDTGWATDDDRDAKRIAAAAREAGVNRIDTTGLIIWSSRTSTPITWVACRPWPG